MRRLLGLFTLVLTVSFSFGQLIDKPVVTMKLQIQQSNGTNGSAVVYNPHEIVYYSIIAGNVDYPLETYSRNGIGLREAKAGNDMRGMWWNPKKKALEGNCHNDGGIVELLLDDKGYAMGSSKTIFDGADHQPNAHSVGTFDGKKFILYLSSGIVKHYSRKDGSYDDTRDLSLEIPVNMSNINEFTLIYTGGKKMEFGVLDIEAKKVYLFNKKDGSLTGTVQLPPSTPVNDWFRFSYANGHVFIYDVEDRVWLGFQIFEE